MVYVEPAWSDVIARVLVTASLISCAIPVLFFIIISETEAQIVIGSLKSYISNRCSLLRPWIPAGIGSAQLMRPNALPSSASVDARNRHLRTLAFQSSILLLAVLLSSGMAIWLYFGRQSLFSLMSRSFFYVLVFCIMEVAFVTVITRVPFLDNNALDLVVLDHLIVSGKSCGLAPAASY